MEKSVRKTVVVSAVNIRKGGTLTILRDCLNYLSGLTDEYRIIALVHRRNLCNYPGIEYIEMPDCIRSWGRRLWAEYVTMHGISRKIAAEDGRKVWTWLSLHDTTPRVEAEHREVYCHTSFPFMKVKWQDFRFDPKIPIFAFFTRWIYRINVHKNDCLIVQQNWFADAMASTLGYPREKIRVIPPASAGNIQEYLKAGIQIPDKKSRYFKFLYVSTPDCHKNFETLCKAAEMLERKAGPGKFKVILTIFGDENRYARFLYKKWGDCRSIEFRGRIGRERIFEAYCEADCFVFPSRIESWGLPISEFKAVQPHGRMILADLPYAHETAGDISQMDVGFFNPDNEEELEKALEAMLEKAKKLF